MTDFFADLERELRRAHAREGHGALAVLRGVAPRRPTVLRLVALTAGVAAVVAVVGLVLAGTSPERERDVAVPAATDPCSAPAPPAEIGRAFSVLEGPAAPRDELPREIREGFSRQRMEGLARVWLDDARFARNDGERSYYVVPALLGGSCDADAQPEVVGDPRPAVCVLAAAPYLDVPACATVGQVQEQGLLLFSVPLDDRGWRTSVLVADGAEPGILVGGRRVEGDVGGNVFVATFAATADQQQAMEIDVGRQTLHSPDTGSPAPDGAPGREPAECSGDEAPAALVERVPVLGRPASEPSDFRLDDPDVAHVYRGSARAVRFGTGLVVLVIPVTIGDCRRGDTIPGVCLFPDHPAQRPQCRALPADPAEPFAFAVTQGNRHAETEVAGIAGRGVDRVVVTTRERSLDVDVTAGAFGATVPEPDPSRVTVLPAG